MSHVFYHAQSSVRRFGGAAEDYMPIHNWFDETKAHFADSRHRALRHHSLGIFWCEEKFGLTILNSENKPVPVRAIAELHIMEDCGFIPTPADWLKMMTKERWMNQGYRPKPKRIDIDLTAGDAS